MIAVQCFIIGFSLVWGAFLGAIMAFAMTMLLADWGIL